MTKGKEIATLAARFHPAWAGRRPASKVAHNAWIRNHRNSESPLDVSDCCQSSSQGRHVWRALDSEQLWVLLRAYGSFATRKIELGQETSLAVLSLKIKLRQMLPRRGRWIEEVIDTETIRFDGREGVYLTDECGVIIFSNRALDSMFGYQPGELCGLPKYILNDANGSENQLNNECVIEDALNERGFWEGEVSSQSKDGFRFRSFLRVWALKSGGRQIQVRIQSKDPGLCHSESIHLQILQKLDAAQEAERHRLAGELHDQLGQELTALSFGLLSLKNEVKADAKLVASLDALQGITKQLNQQVHEIAFELRPTALDDSGLEMALLNLVETWSNRSGISVDFKVSGLDQHRLPTPVETAMYRIVQEALTNVLKHAGAKRVILNVDRQTDKLLAVVADDGCGFDLETVAAYPEMNQKLGLLGIEERVVSVKGTLEIESSSGKGTRLTVRVPVSW